MRKSTKKFVAITAITLMTLLGVAGPAEAKRTSQGNVWCC